MDYSKVAIWLKGYLDAIQTGDEVTKAQIELLISRVKELISEVEENETGIKSQNKDVEEEDLPF